MADTTSFYTTSGQVRIRRGPRGPAGETGPTGPAGADGASGSGTIANTGNLIQGDGAGAGLDSTILPADVIALLAANTGTNTGDQTDITGNAATVTTIPTLSGDVSNADNAVTVTNIPKEATHEIVTTEVSLNHGGWLEYVVTTNDAYTGQTLQDIADLVSDELSGGARYHLDAKLLFTVSADTTGMKIGVHGSGSGSAATVFVTVQGTTAAATQVGTFAMALVDTASTQTLITASSGTGIITLRGFVTTRSGGAPTISIQHLKVTSGTVTCLPGSEMRLRKCSF